MIQIPNYGWVNMEQGEIERLLKTFGFKEFVTVDLIKTFFVRFNSLNAIRNNIVHEDATPSLTHQDVKDYLDAVIDFIKELASVGTAKAVAAITKQNAKLTSLAFCLVIFLIAVGLWTAKCVLFKYLKLNNYRPNSIKLTPFYCLIALSCKNFNNLRLNKLKRVQIAFNKTAQR